MPTEGADSGYLSNSLPVGTLQKCDASNAYLDDPWSLITRRENQWRTTQKDYVEFDLEDEEPANAYTSPAVCRTDNDKNDYKTSKTISTDALDIVPRTPSSLDRQYYNARTQLQVVLQRDMDCREHSFASMQHLLHALTHDPPTDRSVVETLQSQCKEDAINLSEQYKEVIEAQDTFQRILDQLADVGKGSSFGCTRRPGLRFPTRDDDEMSDRSDVSSKAPPVLERYFELAGEENVADERLNELEAEHEEALARYMEQHVKSSAQTQAAYCEEAEEYQLKRRDLLEARGFARRQLQIQRDICLSSGINPERYRYRRISVRERKGFFGRDVLSASRKSNPKLIHANVTDWLQQTAGTS